MTFYFNQHGQITSYAYDTVLIINDMTFENVKLNATVDMNTLKKYIYTITK